MASPNEASATLKPACGGKACCSITILLGVVVGSAIALFGIHTNADALRGKCDVVVVGCGAYKKGMGWYHARQLIRNEIPHGRLRYVVEPFLLGDGKRTWPGMEFIYWALLTQHHDNVTFFRTVAQLPALPKKMLALISARTADNPQLLQEVIEAGATHVYLEKPGAPTVEQLEEMKAYAEEKGVPVYMGYNKNVAEYAISAVEFQRKHKGAAVTFIHNNAYKKKELPECFERNAEGMIKSMAIHELALIATYFGVTASKIESVKTNTSYTRCLSLVGPSGKVFTDFSKAAFTVITTDGTSFSVQADRCGSTEFGDSAAIVSVDGVEKIRTITPDDQLKAKVEKQMQEDPEIMPYFLLQDADYITLKERCTRHILSGKAGNPEGVATIDIAIEALKIAEYLTPLLEEASCPRRPIEARRAGRNSITPRASRPQGQGGAFRRVRPFPWVRNRMAR